MSTYYSAELNVQILIALMKKHGVKKVVASPGSTNTCLVVSLQNDPDFEIYSSVDERSAAYIACGLAAETGEPVALSCTQATASRNYLPALTEAYYRKLPILAITSTRAEEEVGHKLQQVIDRSVLPNDTVRLSVSLPFIHTDKEKWACEVNANRALLALYHHGGGPVHINLGTEYTCDLSVHELPNVRVIRRITLDGKFPELIPGRVGIFVASHPQWTQKLTFLVDSFCEKYNAVVLCDHTSNYRGKYGIMEHITATQQEYVIPCNKVTTLIHIGDMSGIYFSAKVERVWRVSPCGEITDPFEKLSHVFEMQEESFFEHYLKETVSEGSSSTFYHEWRTEYDQLIKIARQKHEEMPFSNVWIAQETIGLLPACSVLHLGIYNSLRSWNFFEAPKEILAYANVGGFGIDGNVSSLIGASLAHPEKLYFGIVGDLAFFYDMNSLGNRHVGKNIRLMVINNDGGAEFRITDGFAYQAGIGDDTKKYISAAGHYGRQSRQLVKHYAEDLGFTYLSASNKSKFRKCIEQFVSAKRSEAPIIFEVFTDANDEREALSIMYHLKKSPLPSAKNIAKSVLGKKGVQTVKKILKK